MNTALKSLTLGAALLAVAAPSQAQTIISQWTFDNLAVGVNASPAPATGTGSAQTLGLSANSPDVLADSGSSTGAAGPNAWRLRGSSSVNGWTSTAAIGAQGAEFDASTAGFSNVSLTFDLHTTTQSEANLQVEYTTDGTHWLNTSLTFAGTGASVLVNSSSALTVQGTYLQFQTPASPWYNGITANITDTAANNNASLGVRIVNASTGTDNINQSGTAYNNTSGNWRLDNVTISATPTPEPSTWALFGLGFAGLLWQIRRRRVHS